MPLDPQDYLSLSFALKQSDLLPEEARYRSCISRAYYGAFLFARDAAGITSSSGSVHNDTIEFFKDNSAIFNRLRDLRIKRNQSDYELNRSIGRRDAERALGMAQAVIQALRAR